MSLNVNNQEFIYPSLNSPKSPIGVNSLRGSYTSEQRPFGREHANHSDHAGPNWFSNEQTTTAEPPTYPRGNDSPWKIADQSKSSKIIKLNYGSVKQTPASVHRATGSRSQEDSKPLNASFSYPTDSPDMMNSKYAGMKYERRVAESNSRSFQSTWHRKP